MRINFNEVGFRTSKNGVCPVCGNRATRSKHFYQTLSPFNKNKDGSLKTSQQIYEEEKIKCDLWKKEPTYHARCEDGSDD